MDTDNYYIKEHVRRHINFYASEAVVQRGRLLYESDRVTFDDYTERTDSWRFTVLGSQRYQVMVKGINNQDIRTSCTCPFDWGSVCKHAVAALLFVADHYGEQYAMQYQKQTLLEVPAPIQTVRNEGFEIPHYQHIDIEYVRRNTSLSMWNQLYIQNSNFFYNSLNITNDSLTFFADVSDNYVTFYLEQGKVYVKSSQKNTSPKLSMNEALVLIAIAQSPVPNLLDEVFSGRILKREKESLRRFGLSENANFNDYFSYIFTEQDGLMYRPSKHGAGMVPVIANEGQYITDFLKKLNSDGGLPKEKVMKREALELGFVLKEGGHYDRWEENDFADFDDETYIGRFEIIPIVGKPLKNNPSRLATKIKEYEDVIDPGVTINKSENATRILQIIHELDGSNDSRFHMMKSAFNYLQDEKFVYGLAPDADKIGKRYLVDIKLSPEPYDLVFEVSEKETFLYLDLKISVGEKLYKREVIRSNPEDNYFFISGNTYHIARSEKVAQMVAGFPEKVKMVSSFKEEFFNQLVKPVSQNFRVLFSSGAFKAEGVELDFHKRELYLSEQDEYVVFTPCVEYDNNVSAVLSNTGNILAKCGDVIIEYKRNFALENEFLDLIAELHPNFELQKSRKQFNLHYRDFTKNLWFYQFFDKLQSLNIEVFGLKELKKFRYSPYKGKVNTSVTSGQDWFEVDISVSFGDNRVTLNDIRRAVINKQRYIQLKDGSAGILPSEWFHKLEKYFRNGEIRGGKLEISKLRFSIIDELIENLNDDAILLEINEKRERLRNFTNINETPVPEQITANLRHYQKEGLNWLNFLDEMQWGGILADDMGLGKTLQVLAFLQLQANKNEGASLIVVPTTLLFNWENELRKFAPALKTLYFYGGDREKDVDNFARYDLVFTTYGILVRDIKVLSSYRFHYAILDESQAIKNPVSNRYKAACLINAKNKIALTGTPIENSTFDLFAQMNFVNRGFLGGIEKFRESYSVPIDKNEDEVIAAELNKVINPFVLRRTKEMVASELPEKTENILYCEMEYEQRRVYDAYRNEYRNRLLNKMEAEGVGKSKMMVLEALTRLRQICDSPALLNSNEITDTQSVKIKELMQHILHKTGRHKILVFSQFVKMLGLIRDELIKKNIGFEYLDGQNSSVQREQSVKNFQEDENLRVFLISIKAGGMGLNLTAADYVYIVDPWWNPAVENQAIDRCHRIGQDKRVFAYRLICKNSVEEKIVDLQNKKRKIAGDIIQTDESILKKLNKNDILELLA